MLARKIDRDAGVPHLALRHSSMAPTDLAPRSPVQRHAQRERNEPARALGPAYDGTASLKSSR
jgi:hypothetical protein